MVKSGQTWVVGFETASFTSGAAADATGTPTGTLVVNGTDNAATVTVTNKATGSYKASVTLPTLVAGDVVEMRIAATVGGVAGLLTVARDTADTAYLSDVSALVSPSAIADAVLDGAIADHDTSGSVGEAIAGSSLSAQDIRDAMKLSPSAGAAATGSIDALIDDLYDVPAATVASILAGTDLTLVRNATVSFTVSGMGDLSGYSSLAFTMKAASNLDDNSAYLKIVKVVAPASNGITRINKAAPATGTSGDGTITVDDESAGVVTIDLAARSAALLPLTTCVWDIVRWDGSGTKHIEASGAAVVQSTATASTT